MSLIAYHNKPSEKEAILAQLAAHRKADEIVKGQYWEDGKGCAVGCTIYSNDHMEYEPKFGIPIMLARLEDCIFEGLPNDKAKLWPEKFMSSIEPGQDLSLVGWKFLHWILTDEKINPGIKHPLIKDAVEQCADAISPLTKGQKVDVSKVESAEINAKSAGNKAWDVRSARCLECAWSKALGAEIASMIARSAWNLMVNLRRRSVDSARSAENVVWSALRGAAESAESAAYETMSDKLIELIKEEPVK